MKWLISAREQAAALWRGADPYEGMVAPDVTEVAIQGWNWNHPYLRETIEQTRPRLIVEIGVWKGASALSMASHLRELRIDGVVIAVDTWLGSWDHWLDDAWDGVVSLGEFMGNVVACRLTDYVVPLRLDSGNAAMVVQNRLGQVDMIHLDAAHDYTSVAFDLLRWWPVLRPGGTFIGDDYYDDGHWPDVKRATDEFLAVTPHEGFEHKDGKWRATKV